MLSFSNAFVGLINILTAIVSIPIIASGIFLYRHSEIVCDRILQVPFFALGIFLLLLSIFGLIGSCCRSTILMWIYLFFMLLLIATLCSFVVFAITIATKAGDSNDGSALHGTISGKLQDYSAWVRSIIKDKTNWEKIQSCIKGARICDAIYNPDYFTQVRLFYHNNLAPIQDGCCKPPDECGFVHEGMFLWNPPPPSDDHVMATNGDCKMWNNEVERLCYECDSCKAGFLANVDKILWKRLSIYSGLLLFLLVLVYSIGCCALHNTRRSQYRRYNNVGYI